MLTMRAHALCACRAQNNMHAAYTQFTANSILPPQLPVHACAPLRVWPRRPLGAAGSCRQMCAGSMGTGKAVHDTDSKMCSLSNAARFASVAHGSAWPACGAIV